MKEGKGGDVRELGGGQTTQRVVGECHWWDLCGEGTDMTQFDGHQAFTYHFHFKFSTHLTDELTRA